MTKDKRGSIPTISVIMPVLNCEKYIGPAIKSVLNQTYKNFELIIVNDGSTDDTDSVIKTFISKDKRIKYLTNKNKTGQSEARNKPIKIAIGKYILLADSDDICLPNRFSIQLQYMKKHPEIDVLGCGFRTFYNSNKLKSYNVFASNKNIYIGLPPVSNPTCIIKKEIFYKYGFYNKKYDNAEDVELWFRWFSQGVKFGNIKKVLYRKRIHEGCVSISKIKSQVFLLLKINLTAITKYHIKFHTKGYLYMIEQFLYLIYLTLGLNKIYAKGNTR